jgi:hypothetical protein
VGGRRVGVEMISRCAGPRGANQEGSRRDVGLRHPGAIEPIGSPDAAMNASRLRRSSTGPDPPAWRIVETKGLLSVSPRRAPKREGPALTAYGPFHFATKSERR